MSKRSRRREQSMFDELKDAPSLEESSNAIFGSGLSATPTIKIKMIDLDAIFPDPAQPRRAIPSELRDRWDFEEDSFIDLFAIWSSYMDPDFDLEAYLFDGATKRASVDEGDKPVLPNFEPEGPAQISFVRLLELATSILREGLTNPISVSRMGRDNYMIETGERRWLAYHLLNVYFEDTGEQDWSKIPARVMNERSVWRQATENNARQNLNAVSRARQLAILLMDIFGWENFRPITDFENEQDFYAQVADGMQWRIPRDKTEQLLKAMGLNNQTQLRQYRAILRSDPKKWRIADDEDWTENAIRFHPGFNKVERPTGPRVKKSALDMAIDEMDLYRKKISKKAEQSRDETRLEWLEFARQQADWWNKLAQKLDK